MGVLCLYVGNSQAGPLGETVDPNDSVIERTYKNYKVDSMFLLILTSLILTNKIVLRNVF